MLALLQFLLFGKVKVTSSLVHLTIMDVYPFLLDMRSACLAVLEYHYYVVNYQIIPDSSGFNFPLFRVFFFIQYFGFSTVQVSVDQIYQTIRCY